MIVTLSANPQLIGQQIASALTTPSMPLSIISQAETKWTTIAQTLITNFQATGTIPNASSLVLGLVSPDGITTKITNSGILSVPTATTSTLGIIKPDGTTITIASGSISVPTATTSSLGIVKPDGSTITISNGILSGAAATNTNYFISYVAGLFDQGTVTGWNLYNDGASATPVDGTGGVVTNLSFTVNNTTPLVGSFDARLVLTADNDQGEGLSYDFTVDNAAVYQPIYISYYYTTTANYVDGDITLWIYDKTNNILIAPNNQDIPPAPTATYWSGYFIPNSNSTSYRLIYHIASTNATGYTFELDQVFVGRTNTLTGTAISGWTAYIPVWTGGMTLNSNVAFWKRIGSDMIIQFWTQFGSAGTTSTVIGFAPPTGYTVDYSKIARGFLQVLGNAYFYNLTTTAATSLDVYNTTNLIAAEMPGTNQRIQGQNVANNYELNGIVTVPISQWSTNINLVTDFTEYASNDGSAGTAANTVYTTGSVSGSQGSFFVAVNSTTGGGSVTKYVVTFQRPIQSTDKIFLEYLDPSPSTSWRETTNALTFINQSSSYYGMIWGYYSDPTGKSITVWFGNMGYASSNATYGGAGTVWSSIAGSTFKWRVRKVSQGNFAEQVPSLIMLPRDNTSRQLIYIAYGSVGAWTGAVQATGNAGIPAGTKAILVEIMLTSTATAAGRELADVAFGDNNTSTPAINVTSHAMVRLDNYASDVGFTSSVLNERIIPLSGSGTFYIYLLQLANISSGNIFVRAKGYMLGGVQT